MVSGAQAKLVSFVCMTSCSFGLVFQEYAAISIVFTHTNCRELSKHCIYLFLGFTDSASVGENGV